MTHPVFIAGRILRHPGFTLVEMLITIVIAGILAALAAPSFQRLIVDTRVTSQANEFLTMINFTRAEAVKRNVRVTMCKSSNGSACTTAGNWEQGWIVFADDGVTVGSVDSDETVLKVHNALTDSSTLVPTVAGNAIADYISYLPNGQTRTAAGAMQGGTLRLCSNATTFNGRNIVISMGPGRARVDTTYPTCP